MTDSLTEIWEQNIDRKSAKRRADIVLSQIRKYNPKAKKVLELGVGLGFVLSHFKNFEKFGLDLGKEYIKVAKRIVPDANLFVQSMHNFKIKEKFDVIFTTDECINEIRPYSNWIATFRRAHAHLNKNGLFILEMPTKLYLENHKKRIVKLEETPSGFIYDNTYVKGNRLSWDTVFFKKLKNGLYRVEKDNYDEFIYPVKKVNADLKKKFEILRTQYFNKKENVILVCKKR
ncbi:class I SAM-dependent methyltransferase [Candidatus Woesearchaeota archaeon]|nr:class I SAM-dependent methyltransferase [Candidatus Woesearchaeota archaeon]